MYGGNTVDGSANYSTVTLSGDTTVTNSVYGGYSGTYYKGSDGARGNSVVVKDTAKVNNSNNGLANIIGGYTGYGSTSGGPNAVGNSVSYTSMAEQTGLVIYGGYASNGNAGMSNSFTFNGETHDGGNSVTAAGNATYSKIYGGYAGNGDAISNDAVLDGENGAVFNTVYGGYTATGNANENTITVQNNADTKDLLYAGYSASGNADSNKLIVTKGTGIQGYAGYTNSGEAASNAITFDKGTMGTTLVSGYTKSGAAHDNTVTVDGGSSTAATNTLYAGKTDAGSAYNNKITINNTDTAGVGNLIAGQSDQKAYNNEIDINDGTVATAIAGQSTAASVEGNILRIAGGTVSMAYGGSAAAGAATGNQAYITGGSVSTVTAGLSSGTASGNTLEVSGSTAVVGTAVAGNSASGAATGNSLTISGGEKVTSATAGIGETGASGNQASVSGGTVGTVSAGESETGTAASNTTTVTGGTVTSAYGGWTDSGTASGNALNVSGGTTEQAFGGYAVSTGTVTGNKATLSSGTVSQYLYGGYANIGTTSENTVTVSGGGAGEVAGGYSTTNASDNKAFMTDGSVNILAGGISPSGSVTGNTADMSGGTAHMVIGGLMNVGTGEGAEVSGNSVTMSGGEATNVYGASAAAGDAANNAVTLSGGTATTVVGGNAISGAAVSNTVTLSGGTADTVTGGTTEPGTAENNTVNVNEGSIITTSVAGGSSDSGTVTGNTLNINGGTVGTTEAVDADGNLIIGGISKSGSVTDNTVNVYGGTLGAMMSLYGGLVTDTGSSGSGNTLNMYNKANTVKNLGRFQTMNFYVPKGTVVNETMVTVTNTADVSNTAIYGAIDDSTKMSKGQVINLIVDNNGITSNGTTYGMIPGKDEVTDEGFVSQKVINKKIDANHIVLMIPDDDVPKIEEDTKAFPENRANATGTLIEASDLAVTDGYASAVAAYRAAWLEDHSIKAKFTPYVVLGGHNLRYTTGSYVDSNGFNGELGFVKRNFEDGHADTIMPFVEYGNGNFVGHQDSGARSDGDQRYLGGGILLRRDLDNGLHYEGMLRAGRINGDYAGLIDEHHASYKNSSPYIAAHVALGKLYKHGTSDFNYYARFFWTHLGADHAIVTSDLGRAPYNFDSVNSYRTRLGFRWTKHLDEDVSSVYAGLGWDYEFDGEARAMYKTFSTPAPTFQGSSGFLELGWQSAVSKDNPWGADVRVTGWTGRQRGVTYSATISRRI